MTLRNKLLGETEEAENAMSELCESDDDVCKAGSEDNGDESDQNSDWEFYDLIKENGKIIGREQAKNEEVDIEE